MVKWHDKEFSAPSSDKRSVTLWNGLTVEQVSSTTASSLEL